MPVLKTLVDTRIKAAFKAQAQAAVLSESDLLRIVVIDALGKAGRTPPAVIANAEDAETDRLTVRMPAFLLKTVRKRAKAKGGMSASRWIASLVQSNIMSDPVMSDTEIEALRASNRELAALGRNLNQIARALNDNFTETDRLKLELLNIILESIKDNRAATRTLVRASQKAWGAE